MKTAVQRTVEDTVGGKRKTKNHGLTKFVKKQ